MPPVAARPPVPLINRVPAPPAPGWPPLPTLAPASTSTASVAPKSALAEPQPSTRNASGPRRRIRSGYAVPRVPQVSGGSGDVPYSPAHVDTVGTPR